MTTPFDITHPLFDEHGLYRLATRASIFADGGLTSVREFFQARMREEMLREWQTATPEAPQEWGYSAQTNRFIHEAMLADRLRAQEADQSAEEQHAVRGMPAGRETLLLAADFSAVAGFAHAAAGLPRPALIPWLTPTAKPPVFRSPYVEPDEWSVQNGLFTINVRSKTRELPAGHRVVIFLLTHEMLTDLGEHFALHEPYDDGGAVAVMERIVDANSYKLVPGEREAVPRAVRLAGKLAAAPALESVTSKEGVRVEVNLGRECPPLEAGTYLLLLLGPEIKSDA